jgi:hypothetical protein
LVFVPNLRDGQSFIAGLLSLGQTGDEACDLIGATDFVRVTLAEQMSAEALEIQAETLMRLIQR